MPRFKTKDVTPVRYYELAGMTKWEFTKLLGEEDILRHYDLEELSEDLKVLEELD